MGDHFLTVVSDRVFQRVAIKRMFTGQMGSEVGGGLKTEVRSHGSV